MNSRARLIVAMAIVSLLASGCGPQPRANSSLVTYFPVQADAHPNAFMAALWVGKLVVTNGCLRVENSDGHSVLPLWPWGFSLRTEDDVIEVLDEKGQLVARVGDTLQMGGGEEPDYYITHFVPQPPPLGCPGPYWLVGRDIHR